MCVGGEFLNCVWKRFLKLMLSSERGECCDTTYYTHMHTHVLGYPGSGTVCGERTLTTAQKLSERTNRARIISICPLHTIVGV